MTSGKGPAYIRARLGKKFGNTYIFGLHSTRPPKVRSQIIQLMEMARLLENTKGRKIVMGDFNSTPYARLLRQFASRNNLQRVTNLPTWPARWGPFPQLAIDHIFLSEGLRPLSRSRLGIPAGSDHYPTIVDVAVSVKAVMQREPIELYYWPTPNGWKVTIMLEECGLPYQVHYVNIIEGDQFDPEFLKIAPNNRMPAIVDPQGPGGEPISVFESGAILQYLGNKTGQFLSQ